MMRATPRRVVCSSEARDPWSRRVVLLIVLVVFSTVGTCKKNWETQPGSKSAYSSAWGASNWIVFCYPDSGLWVVRPDGTELHQLTPLHLMDPSWSPDGKWIAASSADGRIWLIDAAGDSSLAITQSGVNWFPTFSPDGRKLAFSTPDSDALGPRGLRVLDLEDNVERHVFSYGIDPSWSPSGDKLAFRGWIFLNGNWIGGGTGCLAMVDTSGANARIVFDPPGDGGLETPSFAPNGERILFRTPYFWSAGVGQIWVINSDGSDATRLTKCGGCWPAWSPDGMKIVYTRLSYDAPTQEGSGDLYVMNADGSHARRLTFFSFNTK
jgi:Tol biopolymer transport system component